MILIDNEYYLITLKTPLIMHNGYKYKAIYGLVRNIIGDITLINIGDVTIQKNEIVGVVKGKYNFDIYLNTDKHIPDKYEIYEAL